MKKFIIILSALLPVVAGCEIVDITPQSEKENQEAEPFAPPLDEVAWLLASIPLGEEQINEVYDAVRSSAKNGYDDEYTMGNLFKSPGAGVGEDRVKAGNSQTKSYSKPLRDILEEYLQKTLTKSSDMSVDDYLDALRRSDIQIYWPFASENGWDGKTWPVITFDPLCEAQSNTGYLLKTNPDGTRSVEKVTVTEEMAQQRPVWVVNSNEDAGFTTLDILRKNNPDWGAGGIITIGSGGTKASSKTPSKALILKDFTMNRQYDSWFRGASEFFVKIGAVESFNAKTESDMYLYNPSITDFMVVIRRGQKGIAMELNTMLVSEWTSQLENVAFMIIEDDGGTVTNWNCSAVVKYNSKSYGFEISIPYKSRDDIVWRGQLSRRYIEASNDISGNFGDVKVTFHIKEY